MVPYKEHLSGLDFAQEKYRREIFERVSGSGKNSLVVDKA